MSEAEKPTVFVVDDDAAVLESMVMLLKSVDLPVEAFRSAKEFLAVYDPSRPGCLILDVRMPEMSGLELQEELKTNGGLLPTIVVSGHGDVPVAVKAMKAGAIDFIQKPFSQELMLERIHAAINEDARLRKQAAAVDDIESRVSTLTPREREVMDLVVSGMANKQVAHQLGISRKTVEAHRAQVMQKMHADSLAELVQVAMRIAHQ